MDYFYASRMRGPPNIVSHVRASGWSAPSAGVSRSRRDAGRQTVHVTGSGANRSTNQRRLKKFHPPKAESRKRGRGEVGLVHERLQGRRRARWLGHKYPPASCARLIVVQPVGQARRLFQRRPGAPTTRHSSTKTAGWFSMSPRQLTRRLACHGLACGRVVRASFLAVTDPVTW